MIKFNIYTVDIERFMETRDVRAAYISQPPQPVSTLVEVRRLFRPEILLEIEAVAVI